MKRILLIFLPALFILASCKTRELEYLGFENPHLVKMSFPSATVGLDVTCYNPNHFGIRITDLNSDVYINNEFLGKAFIDSSYLVPRQDTFQLPVKMDVKMGASLNGLLKMISQQNDTVKVLIRLDGKARVKKGGLSFSYPIKYEERKAISF